MKANSILEMLYGRLCPLLIVLMLTGSVFAQAPIYRFQSPALMSGTDRQVGARYRFSNVITGVDAHVTIDSIVGGISLRNIDRTADGYAEAFQPEYRIDANRSGYILFTITFMVGSTSTPMLQPSVDLSGLDIDGSTSNGDSLMEMNGIDMGGGVCSFDASGSHIVLSQVGTEYVGRNITGFLYGALVDTSASQVMFTVTHGGISSFKYRVGATNGMSNNSTRYASLYFKRFPFPDMGVLSAPMLESFRGVAQTDRTQLSWSLTEGNDAGTVLLERSQSGGADYQPIAEYWVNMEGNNQRTFTYSDASYNKDARALLYRLKITARNGKVQYSQVVRFNLGNTANNKLSVYPTQVQSSLNLQMSTARSEKANFEVYDLAGRLVHQQGIALQSGNNTIQITTLDGIPRGHFVSVVRTSEGVYSARFSKL